MGRVLQQKRKVGGSRLGSRAATSTAKRHKGKGVGKLRPAQYLKRAQLQRLALRAGNLRIARDAIHEMSEEYMVPLPLLLLQAMEVASFRKRKTIKLADIDYVIRRAANAGTLPRPYGEPPA